MKRIVLYGLAAIIAVLLQIPNQGFAAKNNQQEITLLEAIEAISKDYEVYFTFDMTLVSNIKVHYEKRNYSSAEEAISRILEGTKLTYKFYDHRFVIIYKNNEEGLESLKKMAKHLDGLISDGEKAKSNRKVSNRVTPKLTPKFESQRLEKFAININGTVISPAGEPLIGVNVLVKGTDKGTATDFEGNFTLEDVDEQAVLVVSYIGYQTQEIPVAGKSKITITLLEDSQTLDEVVVVGYGKQKKVNLTGAVSEVPSSRLENRSFSNMDQTLQGVSPGLNFTPNSSYGGEPNAKMNINIRGIGSLSGGSPFVLVDGSPMDLNAVNPNDVESVSILKDAASTAIYGARAAFGVILITTKKGKYDEKLRFNYTNNFSNAQPISLPGFVNSLKFANTINEAAANSGQNAIFADATISRIIEYQNDPVNTPSMDPNPNDPNGWGYWNLGHANTDWWDVIFKDNAFSQKHNLGISGGGENTNYYIGFGWLNEAGKLNFADEKFERFSLTSNIEIKPADKIKVILRTKYNRNFQRYFKSQDVTNRNVIFSLLAIQWPTDPVYTPNGDFALDKNQPPVLANGGNDEQKTTDIWFNPAIEYSITDNWNVNANLSYNYLGYRRSDHRAIISGLAPDGITKVPHYSQNWNRMSHEMVYNEYFTTNIFSDYAIKLKNHSISLMVGGQAEFSNNMLLNGWRRDLVTDLVPAISTAIGDKDVDETMSHWSTLGTFARLSYNFNEKYLLELNGRYDGSSRFQSGRRWGFFPSVAIGYNIWKENFWESISHILNTFKLRLSYGSLGNQNVANYLHEETIPINTNLPWIMDGMRPIYASVPANRSIGLTWETSNTINFGVDGEALNNRLSFTVDVYNRTTENMFGPGESLPAIYGAAVPLKNNATLETKGYEISINWKQFINQDLEFDIGFALADNQSVVKEYNNPTYYIRNFYNGQKVGDIWGFETAGLFNSDAEAENWIDQSELYTRWGAGDVKYVDVDGDGKLTRGNETLENSGDLKIIGNSQPRYQYGINANITFKSFGLSMFWQGVGKREVWLENQTFFGFRQSWTATTVHPHSLNYWSDDNKEAYFARPYLTIENLKNQQIQTRYLQNASYLRLKNLQFRYSIPSEISKRLGISNFSIYLSGDNIFTFTDMIGEFDPETNLRSSSGTMLYPLSRVISAGLNINF
ncbi:SusC/RagA family TonB-linked outer membrane protein [Membranihabitans maritimus]|uniref:SusC/RagA family TonB-linked outer membrane protein n=1 Tax=Membranihabitans maritimus TaxID=2904244 RepID=UPI001F3454A0|nr:TonB-dependent receptor [Membranihabitans maritimus]